VLAGLLGVVLGKVCGEPDRSIAIWSMLAAFATGLVRASVPIALALVGLALLLRSPQHMPDRRVQLLRTVAIVLGAGCGSGAGIITVVCSVPLFLLLRWALPKIDA